MKPQVQRCSHKCPGRPTSPQVLLLCHEAPLVHHLLPPADQVAATSCMGRRMPVSSMGRACRAGRAARGLARPMALATGLMIVQWTSGCARWMPGRIMPQAARSAVQISSSTVCCHGKGGGNHGLAVMRAPCCSGKRNRSAQMSSRTEGQVRREGLCCTASC